MADEDAELAADGYAERRWTRYGHDRMYLSTGDGIQVGYIDLKTGAIAEAVEGHGAALNNCRERGVLRTISPAHRHLGRNRALR